jgi:hypothetical protein
MALMDYTLSRLTQDGSTTVAVIRMHIGGTTTEDEVIIPEGNIGAVTRYRRTVLDSTVTVEKSGTLSRAEMIPFLNTELATRAAALGHTPIESQTNE